MNINQIYKDVRNVAKMKDNDFEGSVEFFLLTEKKNDGVQIFSPDVKNNVQRELIDFFLQYFKYSQVRERTQDPYDVVMTRTDKKIFFICDKSKYDGVASFYDQFSAKQHFSSTSNKSVKDFIAYVLKIYISEDDYVCFVGPFVSLSQMSKTKFVGNLNDTELKRVDSNNMFGLSSSVAMLLYDNEVLINNIPIFEKCCEMDTEFKKNASEVIDNIAKYGVIDGIVDFKNITEEDARIARRLTKMNKDPERVKGFFSNIENVSRVLKDPSFKQQFEGIEFNAGKLQFSSDKRQQFVTLIADAAYESIVGKQKRIDHSL